MRDIAAAHLDELGFAVLQAAGGRTGLDLIERANPSPDLLLVDYAMPDMSGLELARQALTRRPQLAVIIMTGYVETAAIEGQIEGSVLMKKPYRLDVLRAKIEEALGNRTGMASKVIPLGHRRS